MQDGSGSYRMIADRPDGQVKNCRPAPLDPVQEAARILRDATKDKSYRAYPMGGEAGAYLRWKRGMITPSSYRSYEACLDKLAREFPDLEITDFEPPVGTERLEEFLERLWGDQAPRTYNKNLSYIKDFFKWAVLKGKLHGDPAMPIRPHRKGDVQREVFSQSVRDQIITSQETLRDRICVRLLLKYGLRKGALRSIQFKHFDHQRRQLTIFTKGQKIRDVPIVDKALWLELERYILETQAEPHHYLLCKRKTIFRGYDRETGEARMEWFQWPDKQMGDHGAHNWWYECLERAGVVAEGQRSGERMHKARHSAGQNVLDHTGNIKAVQKLLGHSDPSTTLRTYVDWDIDQLRATLEGIEE